MAEFTQLIQKTQRLLILARKIIESFIVGQTYFIVALNLGQNFSSLLELCFMIAGRYSYQANL